MLDASAFREIVSGRRRSWGAAAARGLLRVLEVPYSLAVWWRNGRYDRHAAAAQRVGVPVISVGNLTLGGTGKTPMVKWIARSLSERQVRVAIVSRGYGAAAGTKNDEALELEQSLPGVPHVQNPDRVAGARTAIDQYEAEAILLDDGFQHRRLARDLDIVLLDATAPFGYQHVFPRGMLREPMTGLKRAQVVCLTRADTLEEAGRQAIRRQVAMLAPDAVWCEVVHAPSELQNTSGQAESIETLAGRRVAAFAAIGNPSAFQRTLTGLGAEIVYWREFGDHHRYNANDRAELEAAIVVSGAELVVTTHKDLVKLLVDQLGGCPLWALTIELQWIAGGGVLDEALERMIPARKG